MTDVIGEEEKLDTTTGGVLFCVLSFKNTGSAVFQEGRY